MKFNTTLAFSILALSSTPLSTTSFAKSTGKISGNEFNPAISFIMDGRYTEIDSSELELPGFQLGGEAGLPENGFSTGHNELSISANVDDKFHGYMTSAIVLHDGKSEFELEEVYLETLKLDHGFTVKTGQFFSGIGYLNGIHDHAHDFADRPLVYDALFGGHLVDTGIQARWIAPTDLFLSLGAELTTGSAFPGGDNEGNNKGLALFLKTGGDFAASSSWQLGASLYQSEFDERAAGGHHHGEEAHEAHGEEEHGEEEHGEEEGHEEEHEEHGEVEFEILSGEVEVVGIDFVYKWAPNGNRKDTNFKFQMEYFIKNEEADSEFAEGDNSAEAFYDGEQTGYYLQAVYQFMPEWRVGLRYDHLKADNALSAFDGDTDSGDEVIDEDEYFEESGLAAEDDPNKISLMVDYSPSHFSRLRLQYSHLDNGHDESNDIITLQYTMSLGSHGAHSF